MSTVVYWRSARRGTQPVTPLGRLGTRILTHVLPWRVAPGGQHEVDLGQVVLGQPVQRADRAGLPGRARADPGVVVRVGPARQRALVAEALHPRRVGRRAGRAGGTRRHDGGEQSGGDDGPGVAHGACSLPRRRRGYRSGPPAGWCRRTRLRPPTGTQLKGLARTSPAPEVLGSNRRPLPKGRRSSPNPPELARLCCRASQECRAKGSASGGITQGLNGPQYWSNGRPRETNRSALRALRGCPPGCPWARAGRASGCRGCAGGCSRATGAPG